ncbi:MAG: site-2 protease family protein [Clostridia bacterium]|nr:site-2 protease family protein [Clostridia bacterium]
MLILDSLTALILGFLSICMHELAHVFAAKSMGMAVSSIELQPFGCVMRMELTGAMWLDRLVVALIGPIFSIMIGICCSSLCMLLNIDSELPRQFVAINLALGFINLLPAMPLDGGRVLAQILEKALGERMATKVCSVVGIVLGAFICIFGIAGAIFDFANITPMLLGAFLVVAAINEIRTSRENVKSILRHGSSIRRGEALRIRSIALYMNTTIGEALKLVSSGSYNMIIVLDDRARVIGSIDEGVLLEKMTAVGAQMPISSLID